MPFRFLAELHKQKSFFHPILLLSGPLCYRTGLSLRCDHSLAASITTHKAIISAQTAHLWLVDSKAIRPQINNEAQSDILLRFGHISRFHVARSPPLGPIFTELMET